jgi:hypothetical protein
MSINSNLIAVSATLPSPENTFYAQSAPVSSGAYTAGDTWYVTPLGTQADSANATEVWRYDGTKWVKNVGGASATWTTSTTDPTATGNTGILPRFVENTVNGSKWYIDSTGKGVIIEGAADGCGTVFFDALTPTTATIFDDVNPPVTDDSTLKNLDCAVYISAVDGSVWSSDGTTYKTKVYSYPLHEMAVFTATAGQTLFTLPKTPIGGTGKVVVSRNGVVISDAFTVVGNLATYNPANNYNCTIDLNDKIVFNYEAL